MRFIKVIEFIPLGFLKGALYCSLSIMALYIIYVFFLWLGSKHREIENAKFAVLRDITLGGPLSKIACDHVKYCEKCDRYFCISCGCGCGN